jgi:TorA maturation chaperone TorD
MSLEDLSDILFAREYAYDILRRAFIEEPSQEYLKVFVQQQMIAHFPFIQDSEGIQEGVNEIIEFLKEFDVVNNHAHFDHLHWDYTRMFVGPFELPAPPWESVYVTKDRLLFQESTMRVRREYGKFGFESSEFNTEADDHIGLELDFMYHLNKMCMTSIEESENSSLDKVKKLLVEQQNFLDEHLLRFVSEFAEKIVDSADTRFYVGMAKILKHFLKVDSEVLKELLIIDLTY